MKIKRWLDKIFGTEKADIKIDTMNEKLDREINKTLVSVKKEGKLHAKVFEKTTTYYIAKATGGLH